MLKELFKYLLIILWIEQLYCGEMIMKKVSCKILDPEFAVFDQCELTPIPKKYPALSINIRVFKLPITKAQIRIIVGSCGTTRMPALNQSWDGCAFMKDQKTNRALGRLYQYIAPYTNLNHTCPFNHNIRVTNLTLGKKRTVLLMVPGNYYITIEGTLNGKKSFTVDVVTQYKF